MSRDIKDNMVKDPFVINPQESVLEALNLMRELDIRHLPVVANNKKIVGVVSDRDLRVACAGPESTELTVGDVMKIDLHLASPTTSLREALEVMADGRLGCTVVVNSDNQPVGIFTTTDALYMLCGFIEDETLGTVFSRENFSAIAMTGI